jgi:hypothetical protein
VPDPYELDDEGRPVAEDRSEEKVKKAEEAEEAAAAAEAVPTADTNLVAGTEVAADSPPAADPAAEEAAMRRQIETTLRFMRLQTTVGIIVILALIAFMSSIRGVLVLVLIIFAFSSAGAYWWLRRNLNSRLKGPGAGAA